MAPEGHRPCEGRIHQIPALPWRRQGPRPEAQGLVTAAKLKDQEAGSQGGGRPKLATGRLTVVDELRIESEVPKTRELREFLDKFEADRTSFLLVDDAAGVDWSSYEPYHAQTGVRKSPWQWRSNLLRSAKREEKLESRVRGVREAGKEREELEKGAKVVQPEGLNVYDLLAFDHLIMTPRAVKAVTERLRTRLRGSTSAGGLRKRGRGWGSSGARSGFFVIHSKCLPLHSAASVHLKKACVLFSWVMKRSDSRYATILGRCGSASETREGLGTAGPKSLGREPETGRSSRTKAGRSPSPPVPQDTPTPEELVQLRELLLDGFHQPWPYFVELGGVRRPRVPSPDVPAQAKEHIHLLPSPPRWCLKDPPGRRGAARSRSSA